MNETSNLGTAPHSPEVRVGKLNTIENIRNELARLYRIARKTEGANINASTASKLAYLLHHIARSIEGAELEKRISDLEKRI